MSYDCYLVDKDKEVVILDKNFDRAGCTYAIGGTNEAWLNITYNYGSIFKKVLGYSLNDLDGECVKDTLPDLEKAISLLKEDDKTDNYWDATEYNANLVMGVQDRICCHMTLSLMYKKISFRILRKLR